MTRVSVVIPTYHRPDRVVRAVGSALAQTRRPDEVVVVVDGRDPGTIGALSAEDAAPLKVVVPDQHLGNAGARNLGVSEARGELIALLDDDDEWDPEKLSIQVATLEASRARRPIVSTMVEARSETAAFLWPRRHPRTDEAIGDYLFRRRTPSTGEGLAQTSTLLAPRALFEEVPFERELRRYVDLDWLLRAGAAGATLVFPEERRPLTFWSIDERRDRVTTKAGWQWDRDWAAARTHLLSPKAHAAFLLTLASLTAARRGDRGAYLPLLRGAFARAVPSPAELAFHTANLGLPFAVKDALAAKRSGGAKRR